MKEKLLIVINLKITQKEIMAVFMAFSLPLVSVTSLA